MTVQRTADAVLTEQWLRAHDHRLAANEHARQMRTARVRLDRLLGCEPEPCGGWECGGEFGPRGDWQPHCRGAA